jgi:ParB family chromosome partitioning protein
MRDMSVWLTRASAATIVDKSDMRLLLALLLSGANTSGYTKAVDIEVKGLEGKLLTQSRTYREQVASFPKMLAELLKDGAAAEKARLEALTRLVARSLNFQVFGGDRQPLKEADYAAVVEALSPDDMLKNLSVQLTKNASDYFGRCGNASSVAAIKEALGEDQARQISKGTGKAIAAFAAANVPQTGWLPPQLRPKAYRGPSKAKIVAMLAKKKPAAAPKKKAA